MEVNLCLLCTLCILANKLPATKERGGLGSFGIDDAKTMQTSESSML